MPESLRQFVLKGNEPVSSDCNLATVKTVVMVKAQAKSDYKAQFIARTKEARTARGFNQEQLAELLGIDQPRYSKYETRSYLPHDLVPLFCLACGVEASWLFTGKGRMTSQATLPRESSAKKPARKHGKAA